jgi:hypothetical protein
MEEVMKDATHGDTLPIRLTDPRWSADDGWVKMSRETDGVEIHWVRNLRTGEVHDFKFKGLLERRLKLLCIGDRGTSLSEATRTATGLPENAGFAVVVGDEYSVHAMAVDGSILRVLCLSAGGRPSWFPLEVFAVEDARLPPDWLFTVIDVSLPHAHRRVGVSRRKQSRAHPRPD